MKLYELLGGHAHYWGVPHIRETDNRMVMTCYGCSKERLVKLELHPHIRLSEHNSVRPVANLKTVAA
ncbi:MAG: hypothetical protein AB1757_17075 [Acidobacteriota bacterium]